MAERTQKQRRHSEESADESPDQPHETAAPGGSRLKAELDGLLDEIDEVLETNAEEFVKGYVQKGGE